MKAFSVSILITVVSVIASSGSQAQILLPPSDTLIARQYQTGTYNFLPRVPTIPLGDVNGDGKTDFGFSYSVSDPTTAFMGDSRRVTGVSYWGDNFSRQHDTIGDGRLSSAGDLNGDGFDDFIRYQYLISDSVPSNSLVFNNKLSSLYDPGQQFGVKEIYNNYTGYDLNGDGFEDLINYSGAYISVVFGAPSIEGLQTKEYRIIQSGSKYSNSKASGITFYDSDGDGKDEILFLRVYFDGQPDLYYGESCDIIIESFHFDNEREIVRDDSAYITIDPYITKLDENGWGFHANSIGQWITNVDSDPEAELLVIGSSNLGRSFLIYLDRDSENDFFDTANWVLYDNSDDPEDDRVWTRDFFTKIGDFNGDSKDDFFNSGFSASFTSSGTLKNNIELIEELSGDIRDFDFFGDINNDGFDDIRVETDLGFRFYFGNAGNSLSEYQDALNDLQSDEYVYLVKSLFKVPDLDKDGIEDFGLVRSGIPWTGNVKNNDWIEIYLSGSDDLSTDDPSIIIEDTSFAYIGPPITGDFNGDGITDLAVNYHSFPVREGIGIHIYFGSSGSIDNTADRVLDYNALIPGEDNYDGFPFLENIGDLNGDGIDDLIFSTPRKDLPSSKSYVLYGGSDMSSTWDLEIPYWGSDFENTGDFNGDGVDDIAISNWYYGIRPIDYDFLANNAEGKINFYSTFNAGEGEEFDTTAFFELSHPEVDDTEEQIGGTGYFISSGDFNGDGVPELLVQFGFHVTPYPSTALEQVYLYSGGTEPDSIPDASFKVPYSNFRNHVYSGLNSDEMYLKSVFHADGIKDINGDGKDEILIQPFLNDYKTTSTMLHLGNENLKDIFEEEPYVFYAPNQFTGMGTGDIGRPEVFDTPHFSPVYGDFSGDGVNSFLFYQNGLAEYVSAPVYKYNLFTVPLSTENTETPSGFVLDQNYPNPFNPRTNISYSLGRTSEVKLEIFNVLGQKVQTLVDERKNPGTYRVTFDARNLSSGMYFYKLSTSGFTQTKKMVLIK